MSGHQEYEPIFERVNIQATDLIFVRGVTVTAGPTIAQLDEELPGAFKPDAGPMVMITVQGCHVVPVHPGADRGRWQPGWMPMIASWAELADMAATLAGHVETMPEDVRTRYLARYDRSLVAYRNGLTVFKEQQGDAL